LEVLVDTTQKQLYAAKAKKTIETTVLLSSNNLIFLISF